MKMNKKEMLVLAGSVMASLAIGMVAGCLKEKMMNKACTCIIDEM